MDTGNDLSDELGMLMGQLSAMTQNRTPAQTGQILAVTGPLQGQLGPIMGFNPLISERPFFRAYQATMRTTRGCRTAR